MVASMVWEEQEAALVLKHAHWNVTGPNFIAVHEMLDPEVEAVLAQADETAERIATLGGTPDGRADAITRNRTWKPFDVDGRAFVLPTSTPTQFDPEAMHDSIDRMLAMQPQAMYLTHYSRVTEVPRLGSDLHRLIDTMVAVARAARGDGVTRHVEIVAGLEQVLREEAARQNWALDEEQTLELLRMDIDLNAQGLGIWLDSQRAVEMQPA